MPLSRSRKIKFGLLLAASGALAWFLIELDRLRPGTLEWERLRDLEELPETVVEPDDPEPAPREPAPGPVTVTCTIDGTVTAEDIPQPVPDARVRLWWRDAEGELATREIATDASGAFALEVPLALAQATGDGRVDVALEVRAPGRAPFLREVRPNLLASPCGTSYQVWLERGRTLSGRVLSPDGAPIDEAEVHLYREFVDRTDQRSWIEVDAVRTVLDGRYVLVARRPGTYSLRARAEGLGAAVAELGALDPDAEGAEEIDLNLAGGNRLAGRVLDPDGAPVQNVLVRAIHVSQSAQPAWEPAAIERARLEETSRGLLYGQAEVGPSGEFSIGGLAPGDFWITVLPGGSELDPGPFASGRQDVELVVPLHRLGVVVEPRPGGVRPRGRAYCTEIAHDGDRWEPLGEVRTAPLFEAPVAWFRVTPEKSYAVGVMSSTLAPLEQVVHVTRGQHRGEVRLFPPRARAFGTLAARVSGLRPDGRARVRFEVLAPESRVVLRSDSATLRPGGYSVDLAPGSYVVRAKVLEWPLDQDFSMPVEEAVEVRSRETTTVEIARREGGRVRFSSYPAGTIVDEELARLVEGVRLRGLRPSGTLRAQHGTRVFVGRPDSPRPLVAGLVFQDGYTPTPPRVLFPGESVLLERVLPPGRHVLGLEFPGFEPLRQSVNVVAGEVTEVRVGLVPLR